VSQHSKQPSSSSSTCTRQNLFRQALVAVARSLSLFAHLNIQDHHTPLPPPFHPHLTSPHLPSIRVTLYITHPSISLPRHLLILSTPAFDFEGTNVFSTSGSQVLHLLSNFQSDRHFCKVNWVPRRTSTEDVQKHQEVRTAQCISFIHTLLDLATTSPNLADYSRTRSRIPGRLFG
jgi:hypothetical protein